ncbi:hypothetical protein PMAYCL1PPCAC_05892, partial [Pristionchus mayeri]
KETHSRCSRCEELKWNLDDIEMTDELRMIFHGLSVNRVIFNYIDPHPEIEEMNSDIINIIKEMRVTRICLRTFLIHEMAKEFSDYFQYLLQFLKVVPTVEIVDEQTFSVTRRDIQIRINNERREECKKFEDKLNRTGQVKVEF